MQLRNYKQAPAGRSAMRRSIAPSRPSLSRSRGVLTIVSFKDGEWNKDDVLICGVARTAFGQFQGALANQTAVNMAAEVIKGSLDRAKVPGDQVQEVFLGNCVCSNMGQAPATQAIIKAGLPPTTVGTVINRVCTSSMKAAGLGYQTIKSGNADVVVAAGTESMSSIPYYLPKVRSGYRMGHEHLVDGMIKDGLWDVYSDTHLGQVAEETVEKYQVPRAEQDQQAATSHERALAATESGVLKWEIIPVGGLSKDEVPRPVQFDKIKKLRPCFKPEGTITPATASPLADGASAVVLVSGQKAKELGLPVIAKVRGYADAAQEPKWFSIAPSIAIPKALSAAGVQSLSDVDYWELNEAFSAVEIVNRKLLGLSADKVNVHGGAIAYGHPMGASGTRIIMSLLNVLRTKGGKLGCAAICNGGGGASSMVVEMNEDYHA